MIESQPRSLMKTADLLLRSPSKLLAQVEAGEGLKELPLQLSLIALVGFAAFGFLLGLTRSPLEAAIAAPKLVVVGLGSLAVCLPALYVYGKLLGNRSTLLQVVCEGLTALATAAMTLLALCPVWLAFSRFVAGEHPFGYFHLMLGSVALLTFAGLRGTWVLVQSLRADRRAVLHLFAWTALYGMVGTQSAWMLRPFVGTPHDGERETTLFRPLERSAFDATWHLVGSNVNSMAGRELVPNYDTRTISGHARGTGSRWDRR